MFTVTNVALGLAIASFLAFVVFGLILIFRKPAQSGTTPKTVDMTKFSGVEDVAKLIEAIGKLIDGLSKFADALTKAGPAISALVASIIFVAIAFAAGGK